MKPNQPEWLHKPLSDLTPEQWESLCDGCGKCCMAKLQDSETDKVYYTNVACELLDSHGCRCTDYANRTVRVPDCVSLSMENTDPFEWLPKSCAYRLRYKNKPLFDWHYLISDDKDSVHNAGVSVKGKVIAYQKAGPLEQHLVDWE